MSFFAFLSHFLILLMDKNLPTDESINRINKILKSDISGEEMLIGHMKVVRNRIAALWCIHTGRFKHIYQQIWGLPIPTDGIN